SHRALGRKDPEAPGPWDAPAAESDLATWGRRAGRFGGAIMLRLGVALARHAAEVSQPPDAARAALDEGFAVADRFLDAGATAVTDELDAAAKAVARAALKLELDSPPRRACQVLLPMLRAMLDVLNDGAPDQEQLKAHYVRLLDQAGGMKLEFAPLQAAVRDEVVAWALA
ncbi:MAG: hypothetical protein KDD82_18275, partial [Planctomycetes bacterium]|nr:hypothetical protein [Planctomycetota bacterium]